MTQKPLVAKAPRRSELEWKDSARLYAEPKTRTTQAVVESPSSPIESSPLSTPISDEGLDAVETSQIVGAQTLARENMRGVVDSGSSGLDASHAVYADEESSGDEVDPSFACPDCDKTYNSARSLKVSDAISQLHPPTDAIAAPYHRQEGSLLQKSRERRWHQMVLPPLPRIHEH